MSELSQQDYRRQLEAVCNNSKSAFFIMDEHQQCVYMNPAAEELTGFTLAEVKGRALHDLIHHTRPDGSPYPLEECPIDQAFPQNMQEQGEETFVHKNGSFYSVEYTASPIHEGEVPVGTIIEVRDITTRKRAEQQRERLFNISRDMMCVITMDGQFEKVNSAFAEAVGWSEEELRGRPILDLIHPDDVTDSLEEWEKLQQGQPIHAVENRQLCKDGSYKWFAWSDSPDLENRVIYCVANDVTQYHQRQQALQFLVDLNQVTQRLADPDAIVAETARMLGEHLGVNRCAYAEVKEDQDSFRINGDYTHDTFSIIGDFKMSAFGEEALSLNRGGFPYVVHDATTDQRSVSNLEAYRQTDIMAVISVPLLKEGHFVAGMAVHQKTPRQWRPDEVELVQLVVNRCWEALERARATRHLQASETRLSFILESMPQKIFTSDAEGLGGFFNPQWTEYTGLTVDQLADWGWTQFVHPDDVEANVRSWKHSVATGEPLQIEHRFRRADGEYRWHLTRAHAMTDDEGKIVLWLGASTDIHEFKRVQNELFESEERFRTMANTAPVLIWISGLDKLCYYFNKTWLDFTGRTQEQEYGNGWAEGVHPEDLERCLDIYTSNFDARREFEMEYRLRRFDGQYRWLLDRGSPRWNADGEFAGFIGSCIDITEMKRAKDNQAFLLEATRVISSSLDYEATLSSVANMSVPTLADWCAVDLLQEDGAMQRLAMAHVDPEKVQWAQDFLRRYPYDPKSSSSVAKVMASGKPELYPEVTDAMLVAGARDEDHLRWMRQGGFKSIMIVPLVTQGRTVGVLTFVASESGRRYDDEDLVLAQDLAGRAALAISNARLYHESQESSRLKDDFLTTMSHELRTPLNAILGWAGLLTTQNLDSKTTTQALQTIERNARAQVRLIEDLMDVSRIITGKLRLDIRPVVLSAVVEAAVDAVRPTAQAKDIRLQMLLDPQAGPVSGDPDRLQQVIWNLLSNALKFTPKEGRVQVRLERINSHVEITVTDNGQGISPEFLPHVFDRFRQADASHTRSVGGLGLGLAIVRQLVELHGGTVQAQSPGIGEGSTFVVSLPLAAVHKAETNRATDRERVHPSSGRGVSLDCPPALNGLKVLVVDDEPDARELITTVLEQCQAVVTVASSASEALEALARVQPDVLVSDIGMPGEDGYSLIEKVRQLPPQQGGRIPAVALTAYARAEDRIKALAAGFQMHAPKPVEPAELAAIVASLAERSERLGEKG
jgi:PAS domain S-box-containing protein